MKVLIVIHEFWNYVKGNVISDEQKIKDVFDGGHGAKVVAVNAADVTPLAASTEVSDTPALPAPEPKAD